MVADVDRVNPPRLDISTALIFPGDEWVDKGFTCCISVLATVARKSSLTMTA
jgi:hypothetical protein